MRSGLVRELGLLGLTATGIASMVGAGINVIPFTIQRTVPGIGGLVQPAFLFAAIPAVLAGFAYAILASAMPRAGGSYVYASRALHPYLGFIASFSQWFSLCVAIGVVSYVLVPFLRDVAAAAGWTAIAATLESGAPRLLIPLFVLWVFAAVNILGIRSYQRILVPLLGLTFLLGGVVIVAGYSFDHQDFLRALAARGETLPAELAAGDQPPQWQRFLSAATLLFASYIGFDSIAQAGGEAKDPGRTLPLAIALSIGSSASSTCSLPARCITPSPGNMCLPKRASTTSPRPACSASCSRAAGRWPSSRARRWRWSRTCRRCCSASRG